jgi:hypothetical protein
MIPTGPQRRRLKLLAIFGLPLVWTVLLLVLLNVTNPIESGPLSILGVFILIYLSVSSCLYAVVFVGVKVMQLFGWQPPISNRTIYYLVSVLGLGPVFLQALNTLGQLEIKDIILVTLLLLLGCFYVLRRSPRANS